MTYHSHLCLINILQSGTVTNDVTRVVREAKENIDIKKDKSAIVHVGLGKVCFFTLLVYPKFHG